MPSFTIRTARRSDLAALIALEGLSFPSDRLSPRSLRRLLAAATAVCRVARGGGDLAGYSLLLFRAGTGVARLYSIAVHPDHRGRGLAAALLSDAERQARKRRRRALRLEVREDNRPAIRLYERSGYRPIGRYRRYYADKANAIRFEKGLLAGRDADADEDRSPDDGIGNSPYISAGRAGRHPRRHPAGRGRRSFSMTRTRRQSNRGSNPLEAPLPRRPHEDKGP